MEWISSTDKKIVLTYADKDRLDSFFGKHFPDLDFAGNFEKVIKKDYDYIVDFQNDLNQIYIGFLEKITTKFQGNLDTYFEKSSSKKFGKAALEFIENNSITFTARRYYLIYTHQKYLLKLLGKADKNTGLYNSVSQEKQLDAMAQTLKKTLDYVKKIDKQTEKNQIITSLQEHLYAENFVLSDYKKVNKHLRDVACEVVTYTKEPVTWQFLNDSFRKRNGDCFSQNHCENARDYANATIN